MASWSHNTTRPAGNHPGNRNPPSPGKRRMVDTAATTGATVRLIPRGCAESDEEETDVIRAQVTRPTAAIIKTGGEQQQQTILDTSASRKRKTLNTAPVVVIPSPTTQITRRIDSINLETTASSVAATLQAGHQQPAVRPILVTSSLEQQSRNISQDRIQAVTVRRADEDKMDTLRPVSSSHSVPSVGKSVELIDGDEVVTMEQYLRRPEEAANMKRSLSEETEERGEGAGRRKPKTSSRISRTSAGHFSEKQHQSQVSPSPMRLPIIVESGSSSSSKKRQQTFPATTTTPIVTTPHFSSLPSIPLLPFPLPIVPPTTLTPPTANHAHSSPQHQPKTKSFSINDLLAKDTPTTQATPQTATPFSYINPSLLLLYQQWFATQLAAATAMGNGGQARPFLGESAETDSRSAPVVSSVEETSTKSPMRTTPSSGRYSPHTSPTTSPVDTTVASCTTAATGEEGGKVPKPSSVGNDTGETETRQNALLQVGEAHLAILPDEDGDTPLHLAIIQENNPLTFYLVRLITGVSMNLDIANNLRQTPLHLAVITGQPMLVNLLVQAGASVNHPDRRGNTAIHLAAQRKNVSILQILSQAESHSPEYNARNFAGLTPVHVATREGSIDVLKFLFQMGANRNMADSCSGRTSLHYAVEAQNFQMCNFLLENNVNVNAVTFSGNTPLHVAAGRRLKEIVALLMAYGANPAIANGEGDFPSDLPASLLMQRAKMSTR